MIDSGLIYESKNEMTECAHASRGRSSNSMRHHPTDFPYLKTARAASAKCFEESESRKSVVCIVIPAPSYSRTSTLVHHVLEYADYELVENMEEGLCARALFS